LFGRVDKVAGGLFYVGTVFVHIFFIPLLPLQSFIVRRDKDRWVAFEGIPTTLSPKSALHAWVRAGAVVTLLSGLYSYARLGGYFLERSGLRGDSPYDREKLRYLNDQIAWATGAEYNYAPLLVPLIGIGVALLVLWVLRATSYASEGRAAELKALSGHPASEAELAAEKAQIEETKKYNEQEAARRRSDPEFQAFQARLQEDYRRSREGAWIGGVLRDFARARGWNVYLVRIAFVGLPVLALYLLTYIVPWLGLVPAAIIYCILWWNRSD
jgi:hypothetical protein